MKSLTSFTLILLLIVPSASLAQASAAQQVSWKAKVEQVKQIVVQKVEQEWNTVKVWWYSKNGQQTARIPASQSPAPQQSTNSVSPKQSAQSSQHASSFVIDKSDTALAPQAASQTDVSEKPQQQKWTVDRDQLQPPQAVPLIPTPLLQSYREVEKRRDQLPEIQQIAPSEVQNLRQIPAAIRSMPAYKVSKKGHAAQRGLHKDKAGVATYQLHVAKKHGKKIAVSHVPNLDIGEEPSLSANAFELGQIHLNHLEAKEVQRLHSADVIAPQQTTAEVQKILGAAGVLAAGPARDLKEAEALQNKIMTKARISNWKFKTLPVADVNEKPVKAIPENEMRMLTALILLDQGHQCHLAIGLLYRLKNDQVYGHEAQFHMAKCAAELGLPTQELTSVLSLLKAEDPEYTARLIDQMPVDWPFADEVQIGQALQRIKNRDLISEKAKPKVDYLMAKAAIRTGQYQLALEFAELVPQNFKKYPEAQYIAATSEYAIGQGEKAIARQEKLLTYLGDSDPNIKTLIDLNLGRIAYQAKEYMKAKKYFIQVDKNHPLWLDGLTEEGWAQLEAGDYAGAIGNMYSVHSPFFKDAFIPETYVIRTIGYLDICQYGDAYRSLTTLENIYRPWLNKMEAFTGQNYGYYDTVRKYLMSPSATDINGLPHQIIREMARQKDFINRQEAINHLDDEIARYSQVEADIIKDKAQVVSDLLRDRKRLADLKVQIHLAQKAGKLVQMNQLIASYRNLESWVNFYRLKLSIHLDSRKAYSDLKTADLQRVADMKVHLKKDIEHRLGQHMAKMVALLKQVLDNNELLRYEVFSGSGENIRYQVAGGSVGRIPASVKPSGKQLKWDFDGEYWADEIGNYRSSLVDNCPSNGR